MVVWTSAVIVMFNTASAADALARSPARRSKHSEFCSLGGAPQVKNAMR
jgi:hypothetical protein